MRSVFLLALTFTLTSSVIGQSWEDSLRLGKKYYQEKQFDKAYRSLLEAQKLAPSDVDLSQDIGNAAYRNNDFDMAEKAFRAAAIKNDDQSENAKNWHNVGNSQMKAKNYQDAVESYKQSLRNNPGDEKTRYNLAEAQRRLKVQKKQQSQENKNQNQNQDADKNEQDQQNQSQDQNQNNKEDQNQNNEPNQAGGEANKNANEKPQSKLSDQKTDRMLEELLKQEMKTKKKVQGIESGKNNEQVKSGKKW